MRKALESTGILLPFFFAFIGVLATFYVCREFYLDAEYSTRYIKNCQRVQVGMTLEEAKVVMGGRNYRDKEKSFSFDTSFGKGIPTRFTLNYPTSGDSYHALIHYDPVTGLVTEVECEGF